MSCCGGLCSAPLSHVNYLLLCLTWSCCCSRLCDCEHVGLQVFWDWTVLLFLTALLLTWFHLPSPSCSGCSGANITNFMSPTCFQRTWTDTSCELNIMTKQWDTGGRCGPVTRCRTTWQARRVTSRHRSLHEPRLRSAASCSVWRGPEASQMSNLGGSINAPFLWKSHELIQPVQARDAAAPPAAPRPAELRYHTRKLTDLKLFCVSVRSGKMLAVFTLEVFAVQPAEYTGWWQEDKPTSIITARWQPLSLRDIQFYFCGGGDVYESLFLAMRRADEQLRTII